MKLQWQNKETALLDISNIATHDFLFHEDSLTRFIQQRYEGEFSMELISESLHLALPDETQFLSLQRDEITFIRKSRLKCGDRAVVYARTIMPQKTIEGENQWLTTLGTKPLGDILFNDETTYRSDMRYAKIPVDCELHEEATKNLNITSELWGRQSLFYTKEQPLLITEIFLPAILECSKN